VVNRKENSRIRYYSIFLVMTKILIMLTYKSEGRQEDDAWSTLALAEGELDDLGKDYKVQP
jgi:hypothetical protein